MLIKKILLNMSIILIAQCVIGIVAVVIYGNIENYGIILRLPFPRIVDEVIGLIIILYLYFRVGFILYPIKPAIVNIFSISILLIVVIISQILQVKSVITPLALTYPLYPLFRFVTNSNYNYLPIAFIFIPTIAIWLGIEYKRIWQKSH